LASMLEVAGTKMALLLNLSTKVTIALKALGVRGRPVVSLGVRESRQEPCPTLVISPFLQVHH